MMTAITPRVFLDAPEWDDLLYREPTTDEIAAVRIDLKRNPGFRIRLYHGTSGHVPAMREGLLPTDASRAKSFQSGHGFVYLSAYPDVARQFARIAYPKHDVKVYAIDFYAAELSTDRDQLRNKRYWSGARVRDGLAESLLIGHAAAFKGRIPPERLSYYEETPEHQPEQPKRSRPRRQSP